MQTLIYDVETDGLLPEATKIHCVVMKLYRTRRMGIFVDPEDLDRAKEWASNAVKGLCISCAPLRDLRLTKSRLVAHNQFGFDLHVLDRFLGLAPRDVLAQCVDTLVMSRYLYSDRESHSLEAWGKEVDTQKIRIADWEGLEIEEYLARCVQDVMINEAVYSLLRHEFRDPKLVEGFRLAQHAYWEMCRQEMTGVLFNARAADELLVRLEREMDEIAAKIEPEFGEAPLPKSQQLTFPKKPFKKNGELSATALNYGKKIGITDPGALVYEIGKGPRLLTAPVKLTSMAHVKEYLFTKLGWKPTMWRMNDITKDGKQKETGERVRLRAEKYIKDIWSSPYRGMIWDIIDTNEDLRIPVNDMDDILYGRTVYDIMRRGKDLPMSPQYCNPLTKELCPSLESLQGPVAREIIRWMSMKNRRGVVSGWLVHPRLAVDGRLPAGSSGTANTHRQRHTIVVNLPKVDPKVLYGKEIRELFITRPGCVLVGYDASGLEARIAGHLAAEFDGGDYAREILEGDIHIKNADAYSAAIGRTVSRGEGKSPTYAIMYGCAAKKIASMFNVTPEVGQLLIDAYWDANPGLKEVTRALDDEWMQNGRAFIRSEDGRRVMTRSRHSLLNARIQSTATVIMDRSWKIFCEYKSLSEYGSVSRDHWQRVLYMHDEFLLEVEKGYEKQVAVQAVESIRLAGEFYELRVPLTGEAKIGNNYSEVH